MILQPNRVTTKFDPKMRNASGYASKPKNLHLNVPFFLKKEANR